MRVKKTGFQHREGWMKLGIEERSVRSLYVSPGNPGWIQDSMSRLLPELLRDQKWFFWLLL